MLPEVAGTSPRSARPSVVLPLPDSPTRPSTSPRLRDTVTPSTAFTPRAFRPSSRENAPPWSWKWTASWSMSRTFSDRSAVTAVSSSGFVGNGDLLPGERLELGRRYVGQQAVLQVRGPAG